MQGEDDDGDEKERADQTVPDAGTEAARRIAADPSPDGKNQPIAEPHLLGPEKLEQRHRRQGSNHDDLDAVGAHEVESTGCNEGEEQRNPDSGLDCAPVEAESEVEGEMDRQGERSRGAGSGDTRLSEHEGKHEQHRDAEDARKELVRHLRRDVGPEPGAREDRWEQPDAEPDSRDPLRAKPDDRRHVLDEDREAVGAVGDGRRKPEHHEQRHRQERPPTGQHVHEAGDCPSDDKESDVIPGGEGQRSSACPPEPAEGGRFRPKCSNARAVATRPRGVRSRKPSLIR